MIIEAFLWSFLFIALLLILIVFSVVNIGYVADAELGKNAKIVRVIDLQ